ncbi:MAG: tetratricopeptide repeat protein [Hyphomicrobiaceae bacterium]|nr:tetratricopeptide repeat protein [Hyphomicrobiaceae bacterium]
MVDRTDSFLREVDEDVRRDQLMQIWERYRVLIVGGIVALFVAVGGFQWWKASRIASAERTGAAFEEATRLASEGKNDEALKTFTDMSKSAPGGYQALARLRIAAAQSAAGRTPEALAAYEALASDGSSDELLRDFASLQAAMLRLDQADWTEMKNRLTPLVDDSRPWHALAREVLGMAAYKAGQLDEATKLFEQILGDRATPNGLSKRAQEMLGILTDAAASKAATGAAAQDAPKATAPTDGKGDAAAKK